MLAEALACVLLPLALGRASGSDVVAPVAVAVCALTLGPTIFAFFLGTGRRAQGSNFTRIYNETYAHSRFNRFLLELTRLQKQRRRNARRRAAAQHPAGAGTVFFLCRDDGVPLFGRCVQRLCGGI